VTLKSVSTKASPNHLRHAAIPLLTLILVNHPSGVTNPTLFRGIAHFKPDILMMQESHYSVIRIILGKPGALPYSLGGYKFAALSYYNAVYIYNKNISLQSFDLCDRHIRLTLSVPQSFSNYKSKKIIIQSCYAPSSATPRRLFFKDDEFNIQSLPTSPSQTPIVLMGDFNDFPDPILDYDDGIDQFKQKYHSNRVWTSHFAHFLDEAKLVDTFHAINPSTRAYSRVHHRDGKIISRIRIDHTLVSYQLLTALNPVVMKYTLHLTIIT
jgi:exonuclease III